MDLIGIYLQYCKYQKQILHYCNEYHQYKSTTSNDNISNNINCKRSNVIISRSTKIVIGIVVIFLISLIIDGISWDVIEGFLCLGFLIYLFVK